MLKNNNVAGTDCVIEEIFTYEGGLLMEWLCNLFNINVNPAFVPDFWKNVIFPIYKGKDSKGWMQKLQGIRLWSLHGKLFSDLLDWREMRADSEQNLGSTV